MNTFSQASSWAFCTPTEKSHNINTCLNSHSIKNWITSKWIRLWVQRAHCHFSTSYQCDIISKNDKQAKSTSCYIQMMLLTSYCWWEFNFRAAPRWATAQYCSQAEAARPEAVATERDSPSVLWCHPATAVLPSLKLFSLSAYQQFNRSSVMQQVSWSTG